MGLALMGCLARKCVGWHRAATCCRGYQDVEFEMHQILSAASAVSYAGQGQNKAWRIHSLPLRLCGQRESVCIPDCMQSLGAHAVISSASLPQLPLPAPCRFSVSWLQQQQQYRLMPELDAGPRSATCKESLTAP